MSKVNKGQIWNFLGKKYRMNGAIAQRESIECYIARRMDMPEDFGFSYLPKDTFDTIAIKET